MGLIIPSLRSQTCLKLKNPVQDNDPVEVMAIELQAVLGSPYFVETATLLTNMDETE